MTRIFTWNVASLKALPPKLTGQTLEALFTAHAADIVCLQETKIADYSKLTKDIAVVAGYDSFFSFSGKGYAGVATFARKGATQWWTDNPFNLEVGALKTKPARTEKAPLDPDTDVDVSIGRCVLTDHQSFLLLNIYAPNAGRGPVYLERKFNFYDTLALCVKKWQEAGRKVIVTGDINTAHNEIDIYNPEKFQSGTGFLPQEREWITRFLQDQNMSDAFRRLHPTTRKYSFWDQKRMQRAPNNGWRIDAFYCSNSLFEEAPATDTTEKVDSEILNDVFGSDHCPITLTLPHIRLSSALECKDASSNRPSLNPRRIDGFFSKSVKGQGIKRPLESDSEADTSTTKKPS